MTIDDYKSLIEIQSLYVLINKDQELIDKEEQRIAFLQLQEKRRDEEREKLESELESLKKLIQEVEKDDRPSASKEQEYFKAVEECESKESEHKDCLEFLRGVKETIQEIQKEVFQTKEKEGHSIEQKRQRIENLFSTLPQKERLRKVFIKKAASPLSFLKNGHCEKCGMRIERETEENLERNLKLSFCLSCSRILLPASSRH